MSNDSGLLRRDVVAGLAGLAALLVSARGRAQPKGPDAGARPAPKAPAPGHEHHHPGMKDTPAAPPLSPQHKAVIETTAECLRTGRYCLARCTDHLAAGTPLMEDCQRAVMNMLTVVGAMADVAGYANAGPKNTKQLAKVCAEYCRTCAAACKPHSSHHEECQACMDACNKCAKACDALAAS